jgi:hypothetical protein
LALVAAVWSLCLPPHVRGGAELLLQEHDAISIHVLLRGRRKDFFTKSGKVCTTASLIKTQMNGKPLFTEKQFLII